MTQPSPEAIAAAVRVAQQSANGRRPKPPDENDKLVAGTLPDDPFDGATPFEPDDFGPVEYDELSDEAPAIKLGPDLHRVVDESVAALARDGEIYQRDGRLVRIVHVAEPDAKSERTAPGTPQIRTLPIATLRERLTLHAKYVRKDARSGDWKRSQPTAAVVAAVDARGEWPGIRPIVGVIETPSMRPDGSVIDVPGYDAATGYVYAPQRRYPAIPERPTQSDAMRALADLAEPFQDFPFRADADRYVPIAAILTIVARPAIPGAVPSHAVDKSARGAGGTLQLKAITTLAQGREAALMSFPPDPIELEKVLGAYALRGASVIAFDNVAATFGGAALDKCLTASDRVELRVLGVSEIPSLHWRAVVLANGNNTVFGPDTGRRLLVGRLEPDVERPEERTGYAIPDLPAWCRQHHPRLVAAALTLLRAYVVAGRPDQGLAGWGSFEQWRDLIASAIVWAGGADVMRTRPTIAGEDDSDTAALRRIVELWPMIAPEGATVRTVVSSLYPTLMRGEQRSPDGFDELRDALETLSPPRRPGDAPDTSRLGRALARYRRRVVGSKYLDHVGSHAGIATWKVCEVRR